MSAIFEGHREQVSDKVFEGIKRQLDGPPLSIDIPALRRPELDIPTVAQQLETCSPSEAQKILWLLAEKFDVPATIVRGEDGKPVAVPGVWGDVLNFTDCLQGGDIEARGRIAAASQHCWGSVNEGCVPQSGVIERQGSPAFNVPALSFALASYVASRYVEEKSHQTAVKPAIWIGNAAIRDDDHPTGAPFILAELKGGVIAIVSGLDALSDVKDAIVGDKVWKINISDIIELYASELDKDTHFRSRFLELVAKLFAQGHEVLGEAYSINEIPSPPETVVTENKVETTIGHIDSFGNIKLRIKESELAELGWQKGDRFQVEINGVTLEAAFEGAIADGHLLLVMTVGSTYHGTPDSLDERDRNVDLFLTGKDASKAFRSKDGHQYTDGLPLPGDKVVITKIAKEY